MRRTFTAIAASEGIAIGKAKRFSRRAADVGVQTIGHDRIEAERERFVRALEACDAQLADQIDRIGGERADILRAHRSILQDPFLREQTVEYIGQLNGAEHALTLAAEHICQMFAQVDDETLQARAADFKDVSARILCQLQGIADSNISKLHEPVIVIAADLLPSDTATMDDGHILGFATELGGKTSHTAIMARGLNIPAVVGAGAGLYDAVADGDLLILDGTAGLVIADPTEQELEQYRQKERQLQQLRQELAALQELPARTSDGKCVTVAANIGAEKEAPAAVRHGAAGIGLLRTEFLYMESSHWPTEEEQFAAYCYVVRHMQGKPVIVRTLDIGGDKQLPYFTFAKEENPFLGHRAIRFCLDHIDIFKTQLRAILRASAFGKLLVMLPMVISAEEIEKTRQLITACMAELSEEGLDYDSGLELGIMIETPAAVLLAPELAKHVSFFSIGTNDLTQYILAADRGNENIQKLYNSFHPAVLRAIYQVIQAGHSAGIWVGMCGEFAADPHATRMLLGMGLDEFSVSPARIPYLKKAIRAEAYADAQAFAQKVLAAETVEEVTALE